MTGTMAPTDSDQELIAAASAARERSHVPHSKFAMGAAVRTDTGVVVPGAVVENVSLGLAMCSERVALFSTIASGAGRPAELALVSRRTGDDLTLPCGACLQVALELGGPDMRVIASDPDGTVETATVRALLPRSPHKPGAEA